MSNYKKLNNLCNYNGIAYISNQKFILPNSQIYSLNCSKKEGDKKGDERKGEEEIGERKENDKKGNDIK